MVHPFWILDYFYRLLILEYIWLLLGKSTFSTEASDGTKLCGHLDHPPEKVPGYFYGVLYAALSGLILHYSSSGVYITYLGSIQSNKHYCDR